MSSREPTKRDAAQRTPAYTGEEFTAWLAASCERHGVLLTVTDPIVIAQVATLFGQHPHPRPQQHARRGRADGRSDTPERLDSNGIHHAGAGATTGRDDRVIQSSACDGVSAGLADDGPLAA
jgi:hypothetical protein